MKISRKDLPEQEVLLTIEVEAEDMEPHIQKAYRRVVQNKSIPGFRKGKAPRSVVERFVGADFLRGEALNTLVNETVDSAVKEQALEIGGNPNVKIVSDDPVILEATVPLVPSVNIEAYHDIRVEDEPVDVTDEQVLELLQSIQHEQAPWEPVERPVAFDDQLTIDVQGSIEGKEIINQLGVGYFVAQGTPNPVPGFSDQLTAMTAGNEKEFSLTIPEDFGDEELAKKQCVFRVVVHEVKAKRLSELDDEFAKGVGDGYANLTELKEKIRADLQEQAEQSALRSYQEKVVQALISKTNLSLSPMLVEHEIDHMLLDQREALKRQQVDMDQYLQTVGKTPEAYRDELRENAFARLTRSHALRRIAELEGLQISSEDIDKELDSIAESAGSQSDSVRRTFGSSEGRQSLSGVLLSRQVYDRLTAIARGNGPEPGSGSGQPRKKKAADVSVNKGDESARTPE